MEEIPQNNIQQQEDSHYSTINEERSIKLQPVPPKEESLVSYSNLLSFDELLSQIGFGRFQFFDYLVASILGITEGAQVTIFTLMTPILQREWNLTYAVVSLQISFVFVGFLIGSMIAGPFTDKFGRRKPFIWSSGITMIVCVVTILCTNIVQLLILRALLGVCVGFFAPCCVTLLQEITPNNLRGQLTSIVTFSVALGQMYGYLIAVLGVENWRLLIFYGSLPGVVGFVMALLFITESPRYELLQGRYESGFGLVVRMCQVNKAELFIDEGTQHRLILWSLYMNGTAKNVREPITYKSLLEKERFKSTLILWCLWVALCLVYYGNLLLMPIILSQIDAKDEYTQLVYACLSDIIGAILATLLIDRKGFGRKNSLFLGFVLSSILCALICILPNQYFGLCAILQKMFLSMNFIFLYQLTCEMYPTRLRATGLGVGIAMGRLGGILMPWVSMIGSPFALYLAIGIASAIITTQLPYDTVGLDLDAQN